MVADSKTDFFPDWCCPPADTIKDFMQERHLTDLPDDLKPLIRVPPARLSRAHAKRLQKMFGPSVEFWLEREKQYREALKRLGL